MRTLSIAIRFLVCAALSPAAFAADSYVGGSFFFDVQPEQRRSNQPERQSAVLSKEEKARLLDKAFGCKAQQGQHGQAHCADQQEEARLELQERTRQNHELARKRLGMSY